MTTKRYKIGMNETVIIQASAMEVDEVNHLIKGVKVLGPESLNGRIYLPEAMAKGAPKYAGCKVNLDHPGQAEEPRKFHDRFGRLLDPSATPEGLRANLRYNPAHPLAEAFLWWAKNDPNAIGLSHNAVGEGYYRDDGVFVVDEICEVYSVDIVGDPATNKGLFESKNMTTPTPIPAPAPAPAAPPAPVKQPARENDQQNPTPGGYEQQLGQLIGSILADSRLGDDEKKKKVLAACKLIGGEEKKEEKPDDAMEQLRRNADPLMKKVLERLDAYEVKEKLQGKKDAARKLCEAASLPAVAITDIFIDTLMACPDEKSQQAAIEDRRKIVGTSGHGKPPVSAGQQQQQVQPTLEQFCAGLAGI